MQHVIGRHGAHATDGMIEKDAVGLYPEPRAPNGASLRLTINDSKRHERAREGEGSSSANVRVLVGLVRSGRGRDSV
ncbi:hypothetical protein GQ457_05G007170 [Hibiscus cannabinus]